jgi:hypothetical protein
MPISASGTTAMSQINSELGRSSTALITLDNAENGAYATINVNSAIRPSSTNPAAISEWRGYNHSAAAPTTTTTTTAAPTTTTTTTTTAAPSYGQFINFNRTSSQYARSGNVSWIQNITNNTSFSIAMWVKYVSASGGVDYFFHSRNAGSTSFFDNNIWMRTGFGNTNFGISGQSSGAASLLAIPSPPTSNTWVHVVLTYNGSTKAARAYYNATSVAFATLNNTVFTTNIARNIAFGGVAGATAGNYTSVQHDEVGFFNTELSQGEVNTIYNSRTPYSLTGFAGLIENWKFDSNGNSSTGTANLTLFNSPTFTSTPATY